MLSADKAPSLKFVLSNLRPMVRVSMYGNQQAQQLLREVLQNDQFHELSTSRGWIERARLCLLKGASDQARKHLETARVAATAQGSTPMLNEILSIERTLS
jgi:hypothetical protein